MLDGEQQFRNALDLINREWTLDCGDKSTRITLRCGQLRKVVQDPVLSSLRTGLERFDRGVFPDCLGPPNKYHGVLLECLLECLLEGVLDMALERGRNMTEKWSSFSCF